MVSRRHTAPRRSQRSGFEARQLKEIARLLPAAAPRPAHRGLPQLCGQAGLAAQHQHSGRQQICTWFTYLYLNRERCHPDLLLNGSPVPRRAAAEREPCCMPREVCRTSAADEVTGASRRVAALLPGGIC